MKILFAAFSALALPVQASAFEMSPLFNVEIRLSDLAAAKLVSSGETISINTLYYGDAKASLDTEKGRVEVATESAELAGAGSVAMGGIELIEAEVAKTVGAIRMDLNVFTAGKVIERNILSCGFWSDAVDKIPDPIVIECALIEE